MLQKESQMNVIDNSGARAVSCIRIVSNPYRRYARIGDLLIVSIKKLRKKRRFVSKVKKGFIVKALVVRTKVGYNLFSGDKLAFYSNSVVLLNNNNKLIGTRIFGFLPRFFRYTHFMRLLSLCAGIRN